MVKWLLLWLCIIYKKKLGDGVKFYLYVVYFFLGFDVYLLYFDIVVLLGIMVNFYIVVCVFIIYEIFFFVVLKFDYGVLCYRIKMVVGKVLF